MDASKCNGGRHAAAMASSGLATSMAPLLPTKNQSSRDSQAARFTPVGKAMFVDDVSILILLMLSLVLLVDGVLSSRNPEEDEVEEADGDDEENKRRRAQSSVISATTAMARQDALNNRLVLEECWPFWRPPASGSSTLMD